MHVLSTPPAFILSQDQTLMLKVWLQSKFAWLILTVITVVLVLFWMFSWTSRLNQKPLFLEFSGFYRQFSFQGSLLSQRQLIYFIISILACQQLFLIYFLFFFFKSAVSSTAQLVYHENSSVSSTFLFLFFLAFLKKETEKEGFEPSRRLPDLHP